MKKPPYPWVKFKWLDAYSEDAWRVIDEYEVHDHVALAEGYLVKETPTYVMVSANVAYHPEDGKWEMCTALAVPKGMIMGSIKKKRMGDVSAKGGAMALRTKGPRKGSGADVHLE